MRFNDVTCVLIPRVLVANRIQSPVASKGALEWSGRPKALLYQAASFYAPFLVSAWSRPVAASNGSLAETPFGVTVASHPPASILPLAPGSFVAVYCWSWATVSGSFIVGKMNW